LSHWLCLDISSMKISPAGTKCFFF
jgi:hypothetical protein